MLEGLESRKNKSVVVNGDYMEENIIQCLFSGKNEARMYRKREIPKLQPIEKPDKGVLFRSELQIEPPLRNTRGSTPTLIRRSQVLFPVEIGSCDDLTTSNANEVSLNRSKAGISYMRRISRILGVHT